MTEKKKSILPRILLLLLLAALIVGANLILSRFIWAAGGFRSKTATEIDLRGKKLTAAEFQDLSEKLPDTKILWDVPLSAESIPSDSASFRISRLTKDDIALLDYFPNLTSFSVDECEDYPALMAYKDCDVTYQVAIGNTKCSSTDTTVSLSDAKATELTEKLAYLPGLSEVELTGTIPQNSEMRALRTAFPSICFRFDIPFDGAKLDSTMQKLDLSGKELTFDQISELADLMPLLEEMDIRSSHLTNDELLQLAEAHPGCLFLNEVKIGDMAFSTDAEEIDLSGYKMTETEEIEKLLPCFPKVAKVVMCDCGFDSETMDALNNRYDDIRFVWSVKLGSCVVRTDDTYFIPVKYKKIVQTPDLAEFRYCTDMVSIDIGHMYVHDCEWVRYMPNLEYLIIGETYITDISPLATLKKLKYLEMFTIKVTDYTPLLECTALEDLNLGLTYGDPDVIAKMTWLKNLWWCDANGLKPARKEAVKRMCEALKDTNIKIIINHPTASGWRKLPNYFAMRDYMGMFYLQ